jgi:prefoldin alpha subunit
MAGEQPRNANEIIMQLRYLQGLYNQQYENLENNIATYTLANTSLQRNIELLQKSDSMAGSEIMISGEGGAYLPAKLSKSESVLTYVGGGYMIENNKDKALGFLSENLRRGEEMLNRLISEKQKVEKDLIDIQYKLNALQYQQQATGQENTGSLDV